MHKTANSTVLQCSARGMSHLYAENTVGCARSRLGLSNVVIAAAGARTKGRAEKLVAGFERTDASTHRGGKQISSFIRSYVLQKQVIHSSL